jgi:Tautomerase enzyme
VAVIDQEGACCRTHARWFIDQLEWSQDGISIPKRRGEMPIVRIDLIEGKSEEYRAQVGEIVYQTMVDVLNVPKGNPAGG